MLVPICHRHQSAVPGDSSGSSAWVSHRGENNFCCQYSRADEKCFNTRCCFMAAAVTVMEKMSAFFSLTLKCHSLSQSVSFHWSLPLPWNQYGPPNSCLSENAPCFPFSSLSKVQNFAFFSFFAKLSVTAEGKGRAICCVCSSKCLHLSAPFT